MNVAAFLLGQGAADSPAILQGATAVTYGALRSAVALHSIRLLQDGVQPGDRVGILAENGAFFVAVYLATIQSGLVAVPLQTEATPETLQRIVHEAGIRVVCVSKRLHRRLRDALEGLGVRALMEDEERTADSGQRFSVPRSPISDLRSANSDLASLLYTSGSTGAPKGVMVTHANIATNTQDIVEYMGLTAADRVMVVLPFFYCYGLSLLHTHLAVGGSLVLNNQFLYPEKVLQELQSAGCTGFAGVPSTYQILLRKTRFRRMEFPALRWLQQAGGKLPNPYIQEIRESFPNVRFYTMYGQTEATARLSYLPPERLSDRLGSIGQGLPSTRLEVLRSDGRPVIPGSGEVGEIVASGPNITAGYWNDPEETARYFRQGRLHTGDLARVDADGFIYIIEREREMIKSGGNRVGAKEVEEVIAEIPEVVEVAVIGVPHEILGEAIVAVVAPVRGSALTPEVVRAHCQRRLPGFKVPETVRFLPQLPHNANGKLVKGELKKHFMGDGG